MNDADKIIFAKGYLEAVGKAEVLVEALNQSKKFSKENGFNPYWIDKALAQWEEEINILGERTKICWWRTGVSF